MANGDRTFAHYHHVIGLDCGLSEEVRHADRFVEAVLPEHFVDAEAVAAFVER